MNRKGDIERYILWFIILLVLLAVIIMLYYAQAFKIVEAVITKELIK